MSQILINIGSAPNDGTGDSIREAFSNVNANFTEIYNAISGGGNVSTIVPSLTVTANLFSTGNTQVKSTGFTIADSSLTRIASFDVSGFTANTSRSFALPNADTTLLGHDTTQTITNKTMSGASNTFTNIPLGSAVSGVLAIPNGGTGGLLTLPYGGTGLAINTAPTNGQILIGNGSGFALSTITAGAGIAITNLAGNIVIENTGGGGGGGGATNSITDGTTSVLVSNTSGAVTTTIRGVQTTVANSEVTTNATSVRLAPGTTSRPPILFPGGSLTTTPQSGAMEFDGTKFYITISGSRKQLATYDMVTAGTVTSFNTRTGTVTLTKTDVEDVLTTGANVIGNLRVTGSTTIIGNIYTTNSGGVQGEGANLYTGNISATGNVIATRSISGATITANTAFVGTMATNAQPNITSVGTLTSLAVSGNISAGNITAVTDVTTNSVSATTGTITNITATNISGTITTASQTNITGLGTVTTGTWSATTIATNKGGTGLTSFTTNGAVYATSTSALTTGTLPVAAGGTGVTTSTGSGNNVLSASPTFTGTVVAATINSAILGNVGSNLVGATVSAATIGNAGATLTGTLSTAAQPNVTSVGTLTGLTVGGAIVANANATVNLGSTSAWFNNVFAVTFQGVSTTAKYADLAEKYTTDQEYPVGTVVAVGGAAEVTASRDGDLAIGVISAAPAYLMNSESEGQAVALKGRVPVRVIGPVVKGQRLVASSNGCAKATTSAHIDTFAVALESNTANEEKLVEAIIL